jgi:hypothetical protein
MSAEYWINLYAQAEAEEACDDETAAPAQDSELGRRCYYLDDVEDVTS